MSAPSREQQVAQAEELLGDRRKLQGLAKGLFFGQLPDGPLPPYPALADKSLAAKVDELREYCRREIDPAKIDQEAEIPAQVISGLGKLGILGACLPKNCGGLELNQTSYCRLIEVLGGHCAGTALFVNAHHSIGPRALVLFGSKKQQEQWLPKLASGEWISAFALTEPEAGSDAANVQTLATPTPDGRGYKLNGEKRWITNGGIAQVLTVMARTPVEGSSETKVTAFLVTPDMPGFEVVEKRMSKCGVRGTATSRLAFHDMFVPKENILGSLGKGLKIALTVLDYGRTTFGASCTGAAKFCLERASRHANQRVQFGQPLGDFELVKDKIAYMAAGTFAMEAMTYQTASLIDLGAEDYMLETAMLKVFSTDTLWKIITDTFQIFGGKAYFTDEPYERMMRDGRINMIGEGANDVLRAFSALVGIRDVGLEMKTVADAMVNPLLNIGKIGGFAFRRLGARLAPPTISIRSSQLQAEADLVSRWLGRFGIEVEKLLRHYREGIMDRQYQLGRVADIALELYASVCVLNRMDHLLMESHGPDESLNHSLTVGRYFLKTSARRIRSRLADLWDNDDSETTETADLMLGRSK